MMIEKIEVSAEKLLAEADIYEPPVAIEEIARYLGIRISRAPSTDFSGLLIRKQDSALIGINSKEAKVRQRFTIAHEIGHFILHPKKDAFVDFRKERIKGEARPLKERQADMFAAALLMPRKQLLRDFRRLAKNGYTEQVAKVLAQQYDVSENAMRYRLINLNSL